MEDTSNQLSSEFLFELRLDVEQPPTICPAPDGERKLFIVRGGSLAGPLGSGQVLPGGTDWGFVDREGVLRLDVRGILRMDDGAVISIAYQGLRDPATGYWRTTPRFETTAEKYLWLNRVVCVGLGERTPNAVVYKVYVVR